MLANKSPKRRAQIFINMYQTYFLDKAGGLPIIGQSDAGFIAVGDACYEAVLRGKPLTNDETKALAPNVPKGAEI